MRHILLFATIAFLINSSGDGRAQIASAVKEVPTNAAQMPPPQALRRPTYCPLPDVISMDSESEQRDKLAIWTGTWENMSVPRKFCFAVTSIKDGKVKGIYSLDNPYGEKPGRFYLVEGTAQSSSSSVKIRTAIKERDWQFTFEFFNEGRARGTWSGLVTDQTKPSFGKPFTVTAILSKFQ
jgi:hypothetical protein